MGGEDRVSWGTPQTVITFFGRLNCCSAYSHSAELKTVPSWGFQPVVFIRHGNRQTPGYSVFQSLGNSCNRTIPKHRILTL